MSEEPLFQLHQRNWSGILHDEVAADDLTLADVLLGEPIREVSREGAWDGLGVVPGNNNISKAMVMLAGEHGREMRLREALDHVRDDYDLILIDCAPSLELHTLNALAAADRALVVTTPGKFSLDRMRIQPALVQRGIGTKRAIVPI